MVEHTTHIGRCVVRLAGFLELRPFFCDTPFLHLHGAVHAGHGAPRHGGTSPASTRSTDACESVLLTKSSTGVDDHTAVRVMMSFCASLHIRRPGMAPTRLLFVVAIVFTLIAIGIIARRKRYRLSVQRRRAIPSEIRMPILEKLLIATVTEFEKDGIPYWIDMGTLLGATRGRSLICWDHDVDLSVERTDADAACAAFARIAARSRGELKTRCVMLPGGPVSNQLIHVPSGLALDIDLYTRADNEIVALRPQWYSRAIFNIQTSRHPKGDIFPLKSIPLSFHHHGGDGIAVSVPANSDAVLTRLYGDWRAAPFACGPGCTHCE